ncbi:MAG: PLP-dependent aspartate aminotransferase family protein [Lachnospiraceae bacterium]|nr:PLP-dependent aspartate aminotransferase family protein [Lachnospiraceae bacterium]
MKWDVSFETKCQAVDMGLLDQYHAISFPIYQTATFSRHKLGETSGFDYSRQTNPTRSQLEAVAAGLENAEHAVAFSSGMSAIGGVINLFDAGSHIITDIDLYGGSPRLFNEVFSRYGIEFTTVDMAHEDVTKYFKENTVALYAETPTNPMMRVIDISKLSDAVKGTDIKLIIDNTFLSPYLQNPLELGADIVLHSGTKFLCGHHDTIGGLVMLNDDKICERLRRIVTTTGVAMAPFDSWLLLRGIRTLALRMERAESNAQRIAEYLKGSPYVKRTLYPGLKDHEGYDIMIKQARGFGAMISFEVADRDFAEKVLNNLELFYFAESLGGTETLMTYPITQTHAELTPEMRERVGISDRLLRLSVGIEGVDDLIGELERVFKKAAS